MGDQGIFDELVAAARRIDLGSNSPGDSPSIVAGFGVPTAIEATGSVYYRQDAPNASLMLYVRTAGAWWPISSVATFTGISAEPGLGVATRDAGRWRAGAPRARGDREFGWRTSVGL